MDDRDDWPLEGDYIKSNEVVVYVGRKYFVTQDLNMDEYYIYNKDTVHKLDCWFETLEDAKKAIKRGSTQGEKLSQLESTSRRKSVTESRTVTHLDGGSQEVLDYLASKGSSYFITVGTSYSGWSVNKDGEYHYTGKEGSSSTLTLDDVKNLITKDPRYKITRATDVVVDEFRGQERLNYRKRVKSSDPWTNTETWHIMIGIKD